MTVRTADYVRRASSLCAFIAIMLVFVAMAEDRISVKFTEMIAANGLGLVAIGLFVFADLREE